MGSNQTNKPSREQPRNRGHRTLVFGGIVVAIVIAIYIWSSGSQSTKLAAESPTKWKMFVSVEGQPEPVPAEWVSTPEGRLEHSIKLPQPLPADSGYRDGMSSKEYWEHLCKTQAGEFIYKTVDNVGGFYFARPPIRPTDDDLKDRYKLEAPDIERIYQLLRPTPGDRGRAFVNPPWSIYRYLEEPNSSLGKVDSFLRISGYDAHDKTPMQTAEVSELDSRYALTWRGIRRKHDRDLGIAGSEWIVIDLQTNEVLAVQRNFALTGGVRKTPEGIWWLNALSCPSVPIRKLDTRAFYEFISKVLEPFAIEVIHLIGVGPLQPYETHYLPVKNSTVLSVRRPILIPKTAL